MSPRPSRKERRQEQAREDILEASRQVLLSKGLPGFTLAAVAREVGLTKAALYYYFDSKEALIAELIYGSFERHAEVVGIAIEGTRTGEEAIEALMRGSAAYYGDRLDEVRLGYLVPQVGTAATSRFDAQVLERLRPFNARLYGAVGDRIRADQEAGRIPASIDGRRLAFVAHMAVLGLLVMEGLIAVADDAPLIHGHAAMVDDLVASFRARLRGAG